MARLIIKIEKDGRVQLQVQQVQGGSCLDASRKIEEKIGIVQQRQLSTEFYQQPAECNQQKIQEAEQGG